MRNYVIVTDSCIDMTREMVDSLGIKVAQLDIVIEGEGGSVPNNEVDIKDVYFKLRSKKAISTSAVSIGSIPGHSALSVYIDAAVCCFI